MLRVRIPQKQRFILDSVTWQSYTRFLRDFADRHVRLTYDGGILEIMTLSHEHERLSEFLGVLIYVLTQGMQLPLALGGSTTFRRRKKEKGLEPDKCYWIGNAKCVRGKKKIDLRVDPPPDLAVEVDISRSSLDRMAIYAAIGVVEVWRYADDTLTFWVLSSNGNYVASPKSTLFPVEIKPGELMPFIRRYDRDEVHEIMEDVQAWVEERSSP